MGLEAGVACRISIIDLFLFSFLDLEAEVAGEAAGAVACVVVGMVAGTVADAIGGAVDGMVVGTVGVASSLSAPSVSSRESISNANFQRLRASGGRGARLTSTTLPDTKNLTTRERDSVYLSSIMSPSAGMQQATVSTPAALTSSLDII